MPLLEHRPTYKPMEYQWAFDAYLAQNQAHWLPTEVPLAEDILDYKAKLTTAERNLITQVLRFFTQGDVEVANNYNTRLCSTFPVPEIGMMLSSFANMEAVHVHAYSHLIDTLGLPESEYSAFLNYKSMRDKYEYLQGFSVDNKTNIARTLAVFGGYMEGVALFASFAILMNFPRRNLLKGVGQIITWSIRDETLHSMNMCKLFREFVKENPGVWRRDLRESLQQSCSDMVAMEDHFIDTCFEMGAVEGLKAEDVKTYIRFIADRKLGDLGLDALYHVEKNPLAWLDTMVNAKEHANFFETRATDYSKGIIDDDWPFDGENSDAVNGHGLNGESHT